ncbi:hypothetical protein [Nostoc sp.]
MSELHQLSPLDAMWDCLDAELDSLPLEGTVINRSACLQSNSDILKSCAEVLLQDTRDRNSLLGPIVSTDLFAGLVRTTMHLHLDDLIDS